MIDLTKMDAAVKAMQASTSVAKATKAAVGEIAAVLHAMNPAPPPVTTGGVGLYQLGGSLGRCSHLTDGTYAVVIGDWDDADLLAKVSGDGYVYTVTAATTTSPDFVTLDAANPGAYVATVRAWQAAHGFAGVLLDNCIGTIPNLLAALKIVGPALRAAGIKFAANLGNYVPGDPGSDDGTLWMQWAAACAPYITDGMLENWQQFSGGPLLGQVRTTQNGGNWQGWQRCPSALGVLARFVAVTYGPPDSNAIYGRASLLTALTADADDVFCYALTAEAGAGDPYGPWTTKTPSPHVDSAAGTATL